MTPTPSVAVAGLYIGINALVFVWLSLHAARTRRRLGIAFGDGGNQEMQHALRARSSALESIPIGMLLLYATALLGTPPWIVHVYGGVFSLSRIVHGLYFVRPSLPDWLRDTGAFLTTLIIALAAISVIGHAVALMG